METNDWFFYQEKGKTIGPVTESDLRDRIRDGRIRLFDLIHKEGDQGWRMAMEFPLLKDEFKGSARSSIQERPWVCLQRRSNEGLEFMTTGPFSQEEIRENLLAGRMSYTDYGWKTGFTEWKRLGALEEFNPRMKAQAPPPPALDEHTLLKNVVELRRTRSDSRPPELPPEAEGPDLTRLKSAPPPIPQETVTTPHIPNPEPTPAAPAETASAPAPEKIKKKSKSKKRRRKAVPWLDWAIVGALMMALVSVAFVISRSIRKNAPAPSAMMRESAPNVVVQPSPAPVPVTKVEPLSAPPTELNPPPEPEPVVDAKPFKPEEDEVEPPPPKVTPEKPAPKKPTELKLNVQNVSGNQVRIELRTNGSADFPVYVQVVGLPGQVGEGGAFYRYMRVKTTGSPQQPLDLSSLKLPQGKFILRAATGDLHKEARFHLGTGDAAYKQNVSRLRKQYAYSFWNERLQLMRLTNTLEKRTTDAAAGKKFSMKGLEAVNAVKRSNGANYLLFEDWYELKDILQEAKAQPSAAALGRIKKMKDHLASFSIYK